MIDRGVGHGGRCSVAASAGPPRWRTATTPAASLIVAGLSFLPGCALVGPASVGSGRPAYNEVINATEDQQLLSYIVRERYDETAGMLAVASITANIRVSGTLGADVGFGPSRNFDGNLVPLSSGLAYEESPTITYTPVRGEDFQRQMLSPVSLEQALLLSRAGTGHIEPLRLVVRRVNGVGNPLFVETGDDDRFDRFLELYAELRDRGVLDIIHTNDGDHFLAVRAGVSTGAFQEMLSILELEHDRAGVGTRPLIPIRSATGAPDTQAIDIETTSAFEVVRLVAQSIDVPASHLRTGVAGPAQRGDTPATGVMTVRSSPSKPRDAVVAVRHRGWWFFIDSTDTWSKRTYMLVRTLVRMRLDGEGPARATPLLTLPVGR